eukprot:3808872-Amphidinium_carterae.1
MYSSEEADFSESDDELVEMHSVILCVWMVLQSGKWERKSQDEHHAIIAFQCRLKQLVKAANPKLSSANFMPLKVVVTHVQCASAAWLISLLSAAACE